MYFPPGDYYLGDLCYVIPQWEEFADMVCEAFDAVHWHDAVTFTYHGQPVWNAPTAYGDGCYTDNDGREYGVDSGTIGLVPRALCDPEKLNDLDGLGSMITFASGVTPQWHEGVFCLGDILIDTKGDDKAP